VTTNVTAKPVFCTKQIMAALWSLTRAAVKLLLFQDNDLSYSIQPVIIIKITDTTQGEMSDGSREASNLLLSLKTWKMLKTVLSKRKLIKYRN